MSRFWALQSIVFMISFVVLFDRVHQRRRHYRRLWEMYEGLIALHGGR
jgi:hypothetical protein